MLELLSFERLAETMSHLHDCPFDLDCASLDKAAQMWTGTFLRPIWDDPTAQRKGLWPLYMRIRLPVAQVQIRVAKVSSATIVDNQGIERYSFNQLERTREGMRLCFNEMMRIDLRLVGPVHATYEERASPGLHALYRGFLFVQSGPKIEGTGGDVA